jgi:hypothetical protein
MNRDAPDARLSPSYHKGGQSVKKFEPNSDEPVRLDVTIHDALPSADWIALWQRLLAPRAAEVSRLEEEVQCATK